MTAIPKTSLNFKLAFKAGSQVTDEEFARFERFHPRADGLSNLDYARQLEALGMAHHMTARETVEDFARYKMVLEQARQDGVPVIITTGAVQQPPVAYDASAEQQAKREALAAARSGVVAPPTDADPAEQAKLDALHAARNPTT